MSETLGRPAPLPPRSTVSLRSRGSHLRIGTAVVRARDPRGTMGDSDEEIAAFDRLEEKVSKWKAKRAREGKPHGPEQEKRFRDYLLSQQRPQNTQAAPGPVQPPPQMNQQTTNKFFSLTAAARKAMPTQRRGAAVAVVRRPASPHLITFRTELSADCSSFNRYEGLLVDGAEALGLEPQIQLREDTARVVEVPLAGSFTVPASADGLDICQGALSSLGLEAKTARVVPGPQSQPTSNGVELIVCSCNERARRAFTRMGQFDSDGAAVGFCSKVISKVAEATQLGPDFFKGALMTVRIVVGPTKADIDKYFKKGVVKDEGTFEIDASLFGDDISGALRTAHKHKTKIIRVSVFFRRQAVQFVLPKPYDALYLPDGACFDQAEDVDMNQIDLTKPTKKPMTYSQLKDKKPPPPSQDDSSSDDSSPREDNKKRKVLVLRPFIYAPALRARATRPRYAPFFIFIFCQHRPVS